MQAVTVSGRAPRTVVAVAEKTGKGRLVPAAGSGKGRARSLRCGSARADRRGGRHRRQKPVREDHGVACGPAGRRHHRGTWERTGKFRATGRLCIAGRKSSCGTIRIYVRFKVYLLSRATRGPTRTYPHKGRLPLTARPASGDGWLPPRDVQTRWPLVVSGCERREKVRGLRPRPGAGIVAGRRPRGRDQDRRCWILPRRMTARGVASWLRSARGSAS